MPKILTRLRIDEVSAVDKGAGEGVKVLLMKRADGAQPKNEDRLMSTFLDFFKRKKPASEVLAKAVSALAESVGAIYTSTDDEDSKATALADTFKEFQDHLEQNLTIPAGGSAGDKQEHDPMLKKMAEALGLKIEDGAKDEDVQAAVTKAFAERDHEIAILKANMTAEEKAHHDTLADEAAKAEFRKLDTAARKAVIAKANELRAVRYAVRKRPHSYQLEGHSSFLINGVETPYEVEPPAEGSTT